MPSIWNGQNSERYLTRSSRLDITHEDYTYCIESHPILPLYVSGNRRGILCCWKFGQSEDQSLYQVMPEVDPRQADVRKACVKKIMFNKYGDRIMTNNLEGNFSMYQIDCTLRNSRKVPIFTLYEDKVTDFDLLDGDNILCCLSKQTVRIYDLLMPSNSFGRQSMAMEVKLQHQNNSSNMILYNKSKQVLYSFNVRKGAMSELDLRKNLMQIDQHQLSTNHKITAVCLNKSENTLITGYEDGSIKMHNVNQQMAVLDKVEAFPYDFRNRKGTVTKIKVHPNGGLFASSQAGYIKLMRTSV